MLSSLPAGTVLGGRWSVQQLLGAGACAQVYSVLPSPVNTSAANAVDYEMVVKVIPFAKGKTKKDKEQERICNTLNYEYMMYNGLLCKFPFRARTPDRFYGNDSQQNVRYLVMEKMECDLMAVSKRSINNSSSGRSSAVAAVTAAEIGTLGLQILEGLQWIHQYNFLFIDVKPDNFMLKGDRLYFVDFGLIERMVPPISTSSNSSGTKAPPPRGFAGTPTFCSLFAHSGGALTWHDDLEAMAYVLWSLTSAGKLPWSQARSEEELIRMKRDYDFTAACAAADVAPLAQIIAALRSADRSSRPDYALLKQQLETLRDQKVLKKSSNVRPMGRADAEAKKPRCTGTPSAAGKKPASVKSKSDSEIIDLSADSDSAPYPISSEKENSNQQQKMTSTDKRSVATTNATAATSATTNAATAATKTASTTTAAAGPFVRSVNTAFAVNSNPAAATSTSPLTRSRAKATASESAAEMPDIDSAPTPILRSEEAHCFTGPFSSSFKKPVAAAGKKSSSSSRVDTARSPFSCSLTGIMGPEERTTISIHIGSNASDGSGQKGTVKRGGEVYFSVGRGEDCDYTLTRDTFLSECHFSVRVNPKTAAVSVQDAGSTNGTKLNGILLPSKRWTEVEKADRITVGLSTFEVHL